MVEDLCGVIVAVEVTTGEANEGDHILERLDTAAATLGEPIGVATADAGYAYAKVFGGLEAREIDAIIPTKAEPIKRKVPLRRFKFDARHDLVKCPRGKILRPKTARISHGRFFVTRVRECKGCDLAALCLSPSRNTRAVVIVHDYPALLRARRRRERWGDDENRLYRRHRWRSEGFHGEAKTWHGLARAVRRGLDNMRIQAFLTAAAINLKRLAAAGFSWLHRLFNLPSQTCPPMTSRQDIFIKWLSDQPHRWKTLQPGPGTAFFNSPTVHKHRNLLGHSPKRMQDEVTEDYRDMIYADTAAEIEKRRRAFLRKWRLKCRAVAPFGDAHIACRAVDSLEEAGDRLFTFTRLDPSQWKSARTTNAPSRRMPEFTCQAVIERLNGEFRRRIKTQTVLPCTETVPMLL